MKRLFLEMYVKVIDIHPFLMIVRVQEMYVFGDSVNPVIIIMLSCSIAKSVRRIAFLKRLANNFEKNILDKRGPCI